MEWAGALGDLGTFVPFVLAYVAGEGAARRPSVVACSGRYQLWRYVRQIVHTYNRG